MIGKIMKSINKAIRNDKLMGNIGLICLVGGLLLDYTRYRHWYSDIIWFIGLVMLLWAYHIEGNNSNKRGINMVIIGDKMTQVDGRRRVVTFNGVEYPFKDGMKGNNVTTVDGRVFIDGYELKDGKWVKNVTSMWHLLF